MKIQFQKKSPQFIILMIIPPYFTPNRFQKISKFGSNPVLLNNVPYILSPLKQNWERGVQGQRISMQYNLTLDSTQYNVKEQHNN